MGLLSGGGLKGLFARPDTGDAFAQAQAFLNGDYGTGIEVAARRFRNRRGRSALDAAKEGTGGMTDASADEAAALALPPIGVIKDGHRYLGGDPGLKRSWQPLDDIEVSAGAGIPDDFGSWYLRA
jgi:hypothetical protein